MTYPYTMPVHFSLDPATASDQARIEGRIKEPESPIRGRGIPDSQDRSTGVVGASWTDGASGAAEALTIDIVDWPVLDESSAAKSGLNSAPLAVNGALSKSGEKDIYRIQGKAGDRCTSGPSPRSWACRSSIQY